jgi:hypothetical protein
MRSTRASGVGAGKIHTLLAVPVYAGLFLGGNPAKDKPHGLLLLGVSLPKPTISP